MFEHFENFKTLALFYDWHTIFGIFCLTSCLAMLGLFWMLMEQVYNFVYPSKKLSKESEESDDCSGSETKNDEDLSSAQQGKSALETLPASNQAYIPSIKSQSMIETVRVNPDLKYLTIHKSVDLWINLNRRVFKDCSDHSVPVTHPVRNTSNKNLNLIVIKKSFKTRDVFNNKLQISVKELAVPNKIISESHIKKTKKINSYLYPQFEELNTDFSVSPSETRLQDDTLAHNDKICPFLSSYKPNENSNRKPCLGHQIKLSKIQVLKLQEIATYITHHLKNTCKTLSLTGKRTSQPQETSEECIIAPKSVNNPAKRSLSTEETPAKISIIELDSTEILEIPSKRLKFEEIFEETPKTNKLLRPNKIKNKKRKLTTGQNHHEEPVFSSKQCLGRLAYFMSTNQGYTKSKLIMEIEKELKPIKDQISELKDSMTEFSVINCRYNKKGVKSSTLSVQSLGKNIKSKSIFTVPSMYAQRLAYLRHTSSIVSSSCYPEIELGPKKLSPLAEMYVKLSRH